MTCTVLGSSGFIGSALCRYLTDLKITFNAPARGDQSIFEQPLGHVFYCIGFTADFRQQPLEAVEAHVCFLRQLLLQGQFDSLLYLSSTRVYHKCDKAHEQTHLMVDPSDPSDLYNLSKLMGEALCLAKPNTRIARLSNVYGPGMGDSNFLGQVLREGEETGRVCLRSSPHSCKDYIFIDDVLLLLVKIAFKGQERIYNVASGMNVTHQKLLSLIQVPWEGGGPSIAFPPIDIERVRQEFGFMPTPLCARMLRASKRPFLQSAPH